MRDAQFPRSVIVAVETEYEREAFERELQRQQPAARAGSDKESG
jgi:hypothetical protein